MSEEVTGLLQALSAANARLLEAHDPDAVIGSLDGVQERAHYHHVPQPVRERWNALARDFGESGFEAFQRITLLRLMQRFDERARSRRYSEAILERFGLSFARILTAMRDARFEHYRTVNDILLKDLAICRQKVFPAGGARVVEHAAGFPRSLLWRGGAGQALQVCTLLVRMGGNGPLYSHHTHLLELEEFNPQGFERCNVNLAQMLRLNPHVKGVHCGSWLYDPALEKVSPHMVYMRRLQQDNGAFVLRAGVSIEGGALEKSKTRRAAYERGEYLPTSHHVVWLRGPLIAWADRLAAAERLHSA